MQMGDMATPAERQMAYRTRQADKVAGLTAKALDKADAMAGASLVLVERAEGMEAALQQIAAQLAKNEKPLAVEIRKIALLGLA